MYRLTALLITFLASHIALAQPPGRVLAHTDTEQYPDAPAVIDLSIVQMVAVPDGFGSLDLFLLPAAFPAEDLGSALLPAQLLRQRLVAADQLHVRASIRPAAGTASASVSRGPRYGPYLGSGSLIGGRVEDGRLRGRLAVVNSYSGGSLVDVAVDAPIVRPAEAQALPADGGDPWQGLLRVRSALAAGNEAQFRATLMPGLMHEMPTGEAFRAALPEMRERFPMDLPLERGWLTDVDARLVLLDGSGAEPIRVLVDMGRVAGEWKLQEISYRPQGMAVEAQALHAFAELPGVDDRPLLPGTAISTGLSPRGLSLQPRHAIAVAVPDRTTDHWILLSEAPLAPQHLSLLFSGGSLAPLFPAGRIEAIAVVTETEGGSRAVTHVGRSGVLKQSPGGKATLELASLGNSGIALIDGVIYGHFHGEAHQLLFAAPVHSISAPR